MKGNKITFSGIGKSGRVKEVLSLKRVLEMGVGREGRRGV